LTAIDWKIHTYAELPSTQDYVRELAVEGLPEGTLVQALTQTKGRGRQGRTWQSPMGNLYMSFILRPACAPDRAGQVSFVVAVALSRAMAAFMGKAYKRTLKWPNDVLIGGKKCAGILIESGLSKENESLVDWLAVGVGVDILSPPEGFAGLKDFCGKPVAIHPFRDKFLEEMAIVYGQWRNQGFAPIRKQWLNEAHGLGQAIKTSEYEGVFKDLDSDGALVLTLADGTDRIVRAGDVFFPDFASLPLP
jgi:BirA family biotin operon repressor/biotin-[acetyl-CoA-carboxylase] ligase